MKSDDMQEMIANPWSREEQVRVRTLSVGFEDGIRGIDFLVRRGGFLTGVKSITLFEPPLYSRVMNS